MRICGLQKTTLLDYPGHMAATIFLNGCNFRCPFCHNGDLVTDQAADEFSTDEVMKFLKKRTGILEGVCITGGEPTLHPELETLINSIKSLGYLIKLDTNGYRPEVLSDLCKKGLVDYVAMDIKTSIERYPLVSGVPSMDVERIKDSVSFLMGGTVPYEFRTTVVKELHFADDFESIGRWLAGCSQYFLQNYVDSDKVLAPGFTSYGKDELEAFLKILSPYIKQVSLRGVE